MDRQFLVAVLGAGIASHSAGAQLAQRGSSAFDFKYEMDAVAHSQDEDSNATADWFAGVVSGLQTPGVSGGVAQSDQNTGEVLFRTDFGGSISRAAIPGDYTLELSVRVNANGNGRDSDDVGYFGLGLDHVNDTESLRLNIDANEVSFDFDGNSPIATADNTDGFHVFRIAYDTSGGSDDYHVWRDGVSLGGPFTPSNGNVNSNGAFFIGDFSGSLSGEWEVDYIRIDPDGAFAPISSFDPADLDMDGDVDDTDLNTAFANYTGSLPAGTGGKTAAQGDIDGDGDVDDIDIGTAFVNYTGPPASSIVPEPGSLMLIGLGGMLLVRRRRAASTN